MSRVPVVYLVNQLGLGGSERQLHLLVSHLARRGDAPFHLHVVVFNPSPHLVLDRALEEAGATVHPLPAEVTGVVRRLRYLTALLRRLRGGDPRMVVHSWNAHDNPYAAVAGRLVGAPVRLGSIRGSLASSGLAGLAAPSRWLALRGVQALVVNSAAARDELAALGLSGERVVHLPNCVEMPPLAGRDDPPPSPPLPGVEPQHRVVGMVANLRAVKNPELFVDAMARLLPDRPDLVAVVVGQALPSEPHLPAALEAQIARHGIAGRLILAGFRADTTELVRRFEIACLTSHGEGTPNALMEAMAAGRPVVATAVGGVPALVRDGRDGLLVPPGDADAFARAVRRLLDDPQLARRLGDSGRHRVGEEFSCTAAAGRLAALYRRRLGLEATGETADG